MVGEGAGDGDSSFAGEGDSRTGDGVLSLGAGELSFSGTGDGVLSLGGGDFLLAFAFGDSCGACVCSWLVVC